MTCGGSDGRIILLGGYGSRVPRCAISTEQTKRPEGSLGARASVLARETYGYGKEVSPTLKG